MRRHFSHKDRPIKDVPRVVFALLLMALAAQLGWRSQQPIEATAQDLSHPMSSEAYVVASLNEPVMAAKVLNLWLQAFDNQPAVSLPLHALDYSIVIQWLDTILELDPEGD